MDDQIISADPDAITTSVREVVEQILGIDSRVTPIVPNSNLFDLGADSMNVVEIVIGLEEKFNTSFDLEGVDSSVFKQFSALEAMVRSHIAASGA